MTEQINPYDAPLSTIEVNDHLAPEIVPAGKWLRFFNYLVDYVAFMLMAGLLGFAVATLFQDDGVAALDQIPDLLLGVLIVFLYYIPLETTTGRTLGKLLTGTKVVNEEGKRPSIGQVLGRTVCRFIPFEAFSFFGWEGRGWHDSIPKTYVIKSR